MKNNHNQLITIILFQQVMTKQLLKNNSQLRKTKLKLPIQIIAIQIVMLIQVKILLKYKKTSKKLINQHNKLKQKKISIQVILLTMINIIPLIIQSQKVFLNMIVKVLVNQQAYQFKIKN